MHECTARIYILTALCLLRDIERSRTDAGVFNRMVDGHGGSMGSEQKWWMLIDNVVNDLDVKAKAPFMHHKLVGAYKSVKEESKKL